MVLSVFMRNHCRAAGQRISLYDDNENHSDYLPMTFALAKPPVTQAQWQMPINTPLGGMTLVASQEGLQGAWFDHQAHRPDIAALPWGSSQPWLREARKQLCEYFAGQRQQFELALQPYAGSEPDDGRSQAISLQECISAQRGNTASGWQVRPELLACDPYNDLQTQRKSTQCRLIAVRTINIGEFSGVQTK